MTKRVGFACKWAEINKKNEIASVDGLNTSGTTWAWLRRQKRDIAEQKLWDIMVYNIEATRKLIERVGEQNEQLRMVRLSSDLLPMYTHVDYSNFWHRSDVVSYCAKHFGEAGTLSRNLGVRLSFHPGQFTVLASDNTEIVNKSIEEFEYHADMARWMGYGKQFQDFKINVHISGRKGPQGIKDVLGRLSPEARNCITIENDEMSWGLDASLELGSHVALVLDIHHHWIRTGEYISPEDDRCLRVIDSWRGVRPVIHYSVSREDVIPGHDLTVSPDLNLLLESGHKKQKLRAHSDYYWNDAVNRWASSFNKDFDIMCESKGKNLASFDFYEAYCK